MSERKVDLVKRPLTMPETMEILRVCKNTVYKLERQGFLKRINWGVDCCRYDWNSVWECLNRLTSLGKRRKKR